MATITSRRSGLKITAACADEAVGDRARFVLFGLPFPRNTAGWEAITLPSSMSAGRPAFVRDSGWLRLG
jgi:hypothetical protein